MLIGYTSAHFGKSLLWSGEDALTLYILIRTLDLPPAMAGMVFLSSALWNALCDGLFAMILLRWPGVWRYLPVVTVPAIIGAGIGFAILPMVAKGSLFASIALLFLFRTCFCLLDIPHNALTHGLAMQFGHLPMARLRSLSAGIAALIIGFVGFQIIHTGESTHTILEMLIFSIGVSACLLMLPIPFLLKHSPPESPASHSSASDANAPLNKGLWIYCLASLIGLSGLAAFAKAILHMDFRAETIGAAALLLMTVGRIAAIWFWTPLARKIGSRQALALSYVLGGGSVLCMPIMAGMQDLPLFFSLITCGILGGGIAYLSWAVLTETLGNSTNVSRHAAGFGLFTMSMKIGLGLSALLVGWWLSARQPVQFMMNDSLSLLTIAIPVITLIAALLILLSGKFSVSAVPSPHPYS